MSNVADAPRQLTNSRIIVVPGETHTVGHIDCLPGLIADFIDAGRVDGLDVTCAQEVPRPGFRTVP